MKKLFYNSKMLNFESSYINIDSPSTVFIKITSKCMFSCNFCSQGVAENCELTLDNAKKILKKLKKDNILRIFYTGGEPFLYSKFKELLEYGKELGFCQLVVTNGYLLDSGVAINCLKFINGVSISVHGSEKKHNSIVNNKNSYKKIISGIENLRKNFSNIVIDVCYTAGPQNTNIEDLTSVCNMCKKYNIPVNVTRVYNIGKANNNYKDYDYIKNFISIIKDLQEKKYNVNIGHCLAQCNTKDCVENSFCMAGIDFCAIDINGNVKICSNSYKVIGNIYKQKLKKIWKSSQKNLKRRIKNLPLNCKNCKNINFCLGGCKVETEIKGISLNDSLAINNTLSRWDKIKDKKIIFKVGTIKRIGFNKYLVIGEKSIVVNKNVIKILSEKINDLTINDILIKLKKKYNEYELKNLFVLLHEDGFIG